MPSLHPMVGTCAEYVEIEVEDGVVKDLMLYGGCTGLSKGLSALIKGRQVSEVIRTLRGIACRKSTSCPDQIAKILKKYHT